MWREKLVNLSAFRQVFSLLCSVHAAAEVLELIVSMGDIYREGLARDDDDVPDPEGRESGTAKSQHPRYQSPARRK